VSVYSDRACGLKVTAA